MKQLFNKINRETCFNHTHLKWQPALLWPIGREQEPPPSWLSWVAIVSPIVIIIFILVIAIMGLLLILWLRSKGKRTKESQPPPPSTVDTQETAPDSADMEDDPTLLDTTPWEPPPSEIPRPPDDTTPTVPPPFPTAPPAQPQTVPHSGQRPPDIEWQIAGLTDVGLRRSHNEDNFLMIEAGGGDSISYGLYVVADGLGGHHGGEIASQFTVDALKDQFLNNPPSLVKPVDGWLKNAALAANEAVLTQQGDVNQAKKMGSTLVMALVKDNQAYIANVGDSRAYHLNSETIQQISVDHSLVQRLVQIGQITSEEARNHKKKNVIYNTIGDKKNPEVGLFQIALQPGDRLLLCSDGLNDMVTDDKMLDISRNYSKPATVCKLLVDAAKTAGGNDNITVIIIQIDD